MTELRNTGNPALSTRAPLNGWWARFRWYVNKAWSWERPQYGYKWALNYLWCHRAWWLPKVIGGRWR